MKLAEVAAVEISYLLKNALMSIAGVFLLHAKLKSLGYGVVYAVSVTYQVVELLVRQFRNEFFWNLSKETDCATGWFYCLFEIEVFS